MTPSITELPGLDPSDEELVAVSPRHSVRLEREYVAFVKRAPGTDFVVRTIVRRQAGGTPLMSADIVIAGAETRSRHPLCAQYPLHFRKTYFPGCMHGDPSDELARHTEAAEILGIPPPLGCTPKTFRACLIPGVPYSRLTPFGTEPEESNIKTARELPVVTAAGLWRIAEQAWDRLHTMHEAGLAHGDAELQNFVVCPSPLEMVPIDFEQSVRREALDDAKWQARCKADYAPLLKEAIYLLCALGPQIGPLAAMAWEQMDTLFRRPDRFRQEIGKQLDLKM